MRRRLGPALGVLALVLGLLAPVTQVSAFAPNHGAGRHQPLGPSNINGYNWGGYVATGSNFGSVSATWTVPSVTCVQAKDLYATWVGLDGYPGTDGTVEQIGVATDCSFGSAFGRAWYEFYPNPPVYFSLGFPGFVLPNDSVTASVTRSGSNYTLSLTDNTRGAHRSFTQSFAGANLSAEVIVESPPAAYPNFGHINVTGATVNGQPLGASNPTGLDAVGPSLFMEATPGPLSSDGTAFTITYVNQ